MVLVDRIEKDAEAEDLENGLGFQALGPSEWEGTATTLHPTPSTP